MRTCAKCYWCDQCAEESICKHYDPLDPFGQAMEEYAADLKMRAKAYQKCLKELGIDSLEESIKAAEADREDGIGRGV